ncbi:MAG: hypothetical protein H6506_00140 [Calditrichaeota bacterium]|nr:hypothetical protein [Calditrichota bacterium]MCB9391048.1 hypothetical protein [Calditrichota bacterium]
MRTAVWVSLLAVIAGLSLSCDEDINGGTSSAKVVGYVYHSHANPSGVAGVKVIIESDVESDNPYLGPDRWFETDENGYFEGYVFLGIDEETGRYDYVSDCLIQYFYQDQAVGAATGGITLAPGSVFTMPPRYVNP